jgi:hypothetical protein
LWLDWIRSRHFRLAMLKKETIAKQKNNKPQ